MGPFPSALLTTPDKWISIDFTAAGGGGGRGGAPPRGGAAGGAPLRTRCLHRHPLLRQTPAAAGPVSNKGTVIDRFALEVKGIDAFVKKIEADGVKVTKPVSTNADGLKTAMIVDGVGNDIELIEGLAGK